MPPIEELKALVTKRCDVTSGDVADDGGVVMSGVVTSDGTTPMQLPPMQPSQKQPPSPMQLPPMQPPSPM